MRREAEKILKRCDTNGDGVIGDAEFDAYYTKTAEAMTRFHHGLAKKRQQTAHAPAAAAPVAVTASSPSVDEEASGAGLYRRYAEQARSERISSRDAATSALAQGPITRAHTSACSDALSASGMQP